MNESYPELLSRKIVELYSLNREFVDDHLRKYREYRQREIIDYQKVCSEVHTTYESCFVLSTGRTGTWLLTKLLNRSKQVAAYHSHPEAFRYYVRYSYELNQSNPEALKQVLEATRTELLIKEYLRDRIYVETDDRIAFFAPQLAELYERSKFIHLVRHPVDVIRSRMRRETYMNRIEDLGRIIDRNNNNWENLSRLEKISWLWNETNSFIENFKDSIEDNSRFLTIKSEDLFSNVEVARSIFEFLKVEYIGDRQVNKVIGRRVNKQSTGSYPKYRDWSDEQKEILSRHVKIHQRYGYQI